MALPNLTQRTMTTHCKACGHQWESAFPLPMLMDRALRVMRGIVAAGCPNCGAHGSSVMCGPAPEKKEASRG